MGDGINQDFPDHPAVRQVVRGGAGGQEVLGSGADGQGDRELSVSVAPRDVHPGAGVVFDLIRWNENREFRYFGAEERGVVPLEDEP